jgi:hypothetical protein
MAEYINLEKPFLDKLHQFGWDLLLKGTTVNKKELTGEINTEILCCCEIQIIFYLRFLSGKKN